MFNVLLSLDDLSHASFVVEVGPEHGFYDPNIWRAFVEGNGDTPIAIRDVLASALLEGGEPLLLQFRVGPCRTEYEALRAQNKPNTKQRATGRSHLPTREVLALRN